MIFNLIDKFSIHLNLLNLKFECIKLFTFYLTVISFEQVYLGSIDVSIMISRKCDIYKN
jgi:hypothetical protein